MEFIGELFPIANTTGKVVKRKKLLTLLLRLVTKRLLFSQIYRLSIDQRILSVRPSLQLPSASDWCRILIWRFSPSCCCANDRSVVNTAAQLLQSLVDYHIPANSKLSSLFFFVFVILEMISLQLMNCWVRLISSIVIMIRQLRWREHFSPIKNQFLGPC